ncbi:hypothetical protein Y032_0027g1508 [Ancylostoma ceylanicum]|uniref:Uncharacterized protein n=1 Tax=Ancylostoma ceylanicum TaxID=53326 RepID=A0A016UTY8_9BILA|nr:hypothetical protein Y032_0027g1508 [Ancylostoma ceylanicum]
MQAGVIEHGFVEVSRISLDSISKERQFILVRHTKGDTRIRVSPDFATTAGGRHMDKVKEETPGERGDELRLAAIYGDVK